MSRLRPLFARGRLRRELAEELRAHLEEKVDEFVAGGLARDEALARARRELGNVSLIEERAADVWRLPLLDDFALDLRHAVRVLARSPRFTLVAVLTLALGIGANTAIFSVVNSVLLKPLPFPRAEELVRVFSTHDGLPIGPSPPDLRDMAHDSRTFSQLVAYDTWRKNLSTPSGDPEQIRVGLVPAEYFMALGINPIRGRLFTADENRWGNHHVAIVSDSFWKSRFACDPAILGRNIRINEEPYAIIGVIPDAIPSWMDPLNTKVHVWTPFAPSEVDLWAEEDRDGRGYFTIGRLKPGVSIEQARADLQLIAGGLAARHPVDRGYGATVEPLINSRVGTLRPMLLLLMGAVGLILLIACFNVANLIMARNSARQHDVAIRAALGASRARLVRQLFTEGLLLALAGGAVGLVMAGLGDKVLGSLHPAAAEQLAEAAIDGRVLVFTLTVAILTSLAFGIAPAYSLATVHPQAALKDGGRGDTGGRERRSLRRGLVASEVALSLMLSIGAGLLIQSVVKLQSQDLGFRADHLLTEHLFLPGARYPDPDTITRFSDRYTERARNLGGVIDATATDMVPPAYHWQFVIGVVGRTAPEAGAVTAANFGVSDTHYLKTLGLTLRRGRDFAETDTAASPRVALINDTLARRLFPDEDPIGKQLDVGTPGRLAPAEDGKPMPRLTIIGVIGDMKNRGLSLAPDPDLIGLYRQNPEQNFGFKSLVVRTAVKPSAIIPNLRKELRALDPDLPFADVRTMDQIVEQHAADGVFGRSLLTLFAILGVCLAVVGVYGVVSYMVAQRRKEIAIRVALGASAADLLRLILREGVMVGLVGIGLGLAGALAGAQLAAGILFGVSPRDPPTFLGSALVIVAVVVVATIAPCQQAMRIDALDLLKGD